MGTIAQSPELIARERQVATELMRSGLPYVSACASIGNTTHESLSKPIAPSPDGSNCLFQWRDATGVHRLSDMKAWCAAQGHDWKTISAQCLFFVYELQKNYHGLWADLEAGTKSLATLTANIETYYERPAKLSDLDDRIATAQYCFDNFKDLVAPIAPPVIAIQPGAGITISAESSVLSQLMAHWRGCKTAADDAQKALISARAAVDTEIARIENEVAESKKALAGAPSSTTGIATG